MNQLPASLDFIPDDKSSLHAFGTMLNKLWQVLSINWNSIFPATLYTPVITAQTGTFSNASASGRYRQIGKLIFIQIAAVITTNGTGASWVNVTLPFAAINVTNGHHMLAGGDLNGSSVAGFVIPNTNQLRIFKYDGSYPGADGKTFVLSGFYEIS